MPSSRGLCCRAETGEEEEPVLARERVQLKLTCILVFLCSNGVLKQGCDQPLLFSYWNPKWLLLVPN